MFDDTNCFASYEALAILKHSHSAYLRYMLVFFGVQIKNLFCASTIRFFTFPPVVIIIFHQNIIRKFVDIWLQSRHRILYSDPGAVKFINVHRIIFPDLIIFFIQKNYIV